MLTERVTMSELAFDVLWEGEIGEVSTKPVPLYGPSPGETWGERAEYYRQALSELADAGLTSGDDPHPDLVATVRLLDRPDTEVHGFIGSTAEDGAPVTTYFVAAQQPRGSVLAIREHGTVTLTPLSGRALLREVVDLLPPCEAIADQPRTFPAALATVEAAHPITGALDTQAARGSRGYEREDADHIAQLLAQSRTGAGQLSVTTRDSSGQRRHSAHPVHYFDVARGRFLTVRKRSDNGEDWMVTLPGTPANLARQLAEITPGRSS